MAEGYVLSPELLSGLREMLYEYRRRQKFVLSRVPDAETLAAPDVYVAMTPEGGIPALTLTSAGLLEITGTGSGSDYGTGTAEVFPVPGSAYCDIYQVSGEFTDTPILINVFGTTHQVFNCSPNAISGEQYIIVLRDKMGIWWASSIQGNASGSSSRCTGTLRFITAICRVTDPDTGTGTGTSGSPGTA